IPKSEYDTAQAAYDAAVAMLDAARAKEESLAGASGSAQAQLRVAEAMLQAARAQVELKEAALYQASLDLEYTTIHAPVDGVVVSRAVDVGQTVAASLAAPTLFTIARDLTKMQVEVSVDEADIGRVRVDGPAKFTVDAFPGETFNGRVVQVRKAAQIVQSVVTYTVIVAVDNPDGHLLPGMTANVKLIVAEKPSVLKVANAALRFRPPGGETKSKDDKSRERKSKSERSTGDDGRSGVGGRVWIRGPDGEPSPWRSGSASPTAARPRSSEATSKRGRKSLSATVVAAAGRKRARAGARPASGAEPWR